MNGQRWILAAGSLSLLFLASVPFLGAGNYWIRLATNGFMYITLASSWNITGGFLGYPSFATAAFFGLGAYGASLLRLQLSCPLVLAWAGGAVFAALFAAVIGPAILRLRGHYFAVASVVLASVLRETVNGATELTGGGMGLTLSPAFGLDAKGQALLYYNSMLGAACATILAAAIIRRTRLGLALRCIQQNEDAAIVLGVNTLSAKIAALAASALTAGLAGAVYASWIGYIDPTDVFDDLISVKPIVMAFLGGAGTILGPVLGGGLFLALEELVWRNVLNFHAGILGLLIVFLLVFARGGLAPILKRLSGEIRFPRNLSRRLKPSRP
jgi:branched-chain amino acid transport system permease protein